MTASNSAEREVETVTTTVNVEVLWEDYTDSTSKTSVKQSYQMDLAFYGYDTLDDIHLSLQAKAGQSTEHIRAAAMSCMTQSNALQARLSAQLQCLGLHDGDRTTSQLCAQAVNAGVVVELILAPFSTLKEYVECMYRGIQKRHLASVGAEEKGLVRQGKGKLG